MAGYNEQKSGMVLADLNQIVNSYLQENPGRKSSSAKKNASETKVLDWTGVKISICDPPVYVKKEGSVRTGSVRSCLRKLKNLTKVDQHFDIGEMTTMGTNKFDVSIFAGIKPGPVSIPLLLPDDLQMRYLGKEILVGESGVRQNTSHISAKITVPAEQEVEAVIYCDEILMKATFTQRIRVTGTVIVRHYDKTGTFSSQTTISMRELLHKRISNSELLHDGVELEIQGSCNFHVTTNSEVMLQGKDIDEATKDGAKK